MARRGWTLDNIRDVLANPERTVATVDWRHLPGGTRLEQPATAYVRRDGHYVVINDLTRDVVQLSDRTATDWLAPFEKEEEE